MTLQEQLLDLDMTVNRLSKGIHAVTLMSMGLNETRDPNLDGLDTAVYQVFKGINAVEAMTMGLHRAVDPYADGFSAICDYLLQADRNLREHMDICLKAM